MTDRAETQHDQLDKIASKLLETASKLPPGAERHDFLKEIGKIRSQISALKAKGK
jgi:ubiquinone biosynthesis protein UbiJ